MTTRFAEGRVLRPTRKVLPGHARSHNRSLVLQTLYRASGLSRADIARETGLTRVTVSDLVAELISTGLLVETGQSENVRPGKPSTLLELDRDAHRIVGVDLSDASVFRGALLDLGGTVLDRQERALDGRTGAAAIELVTELVLSLAVASTRPVLGVGIGSPGIVDETGVVLSAPNLGWHEEPLQAILSARTGLAVVVANDANTAVLAEHSFGDASNDLMLVKVGHGVGSGLILAGQPHFGSRFSAGEIGHVVVGTDGGIECVCGKRGCLETWLATPRLDAALAAASSDAERDEVLRAAGERLGIALAPVVGALDLPEIVVSGPARLIDGILAEAAAQTFRDRTMADFHGDLVVRMTELGEDIVMRGAAAMVLSVQLGVS